MRDALTIGSGTFPAQLKSPLAEPLTRPVTPLARHVYQVYALHRDELTIEFRGVEDFNAMDDATLKQLLADFHEALQIEPLPSDVWAR